MSNELTVLEAALAWAQGKKVEAGPSASCKWLPVDPVGKSLEGHYGVTVFSDADFRFRLAPEPPAKRYRPWRLDEVPVGAVIRWQSATNRGGFSLIVSTYETNDGAVWVCGGQSKQWHVEEAVKLDHSTDNGKTWLPCGVEVES